MQTRTNQEAGAEKSGKRRRCRRLNGRSYHHRITAVISLCPTYLASAIVDLKPARRIMACRKASTHVKTDAQLLQRNRHESLNFDPARSQGLLRMGRHKLANEVGAGGKFCE